MRNKFDKIICSILLIAAFTSCKPEDNIKTQVPQKTDTIPTIEWVTIPYDTFYMGSYINESGTGVLSIQSDGTEVQINKGSSEYMARFVTDGAVKLYYDNSLKFETTSTGVSVTGGVDVTGGATVFNNVSQDKKCAFRRTGANNYSLPLATNTVRGGIELFSDTDQTVAANSITTTANRTYGIQLNSANQAVVNVPWVGGGGIELTDLSATTASPGTTGLAYNNTTGVFTYTPAVAITNNNQLTNGAGYTTNTGTVTPSSTDTFTNKSGNISQWTNNSGYTTNVGDVTLSGNNAFTGNNTFSTEIAANAGIAVAGSADITTASAVNATASTFKNGSYTAGKVNTHVQSLSGSLSIGKQGAGLRFSHYLDNFGLPVRNIIPYNVDTNSNSDNLVDLGNSSARFDDIYATNATIQTSDRNEKQDIAELSAAETRVAVACKGLLRKFRWKSSVEEKGNASRTHFGIIAQDLQAAFEAEGLDAGNYAMFISTTWTNEDGEEQTRLGVRYSELLAFIIGGI